MVLENINFIDILCRELVFSSCLNIQSHMQPKFGSHYSPCSECLARPGVVLFLTAIRIHKDLSVHLGDGELWYANDLEKQKKKKLMGSLRI